MGNLISRSELLKHSRKVTEYDEAGYSRVYRAVSVEDIKYAPTAYDVDKIVEELERRETVKREIAKEYLDDFCLEMYHLYDNEADGIKEAIEIVKGGGVNERD